MEAELKRRLDRIGRLQKLDSLRLDQAAQLLEQATQVWSRIAGELAALRREHEQTLADCPPGLELRSQIPVWSQWSLSRQETVHGRLEAARRECDLRRAEFARCRARCEAWRKLIERLERRRTAGDRRREFLSADEAAARNSGRGAGPSPPVALLPHNDLHDPSTRTA